MLYCSTHPAPLFFELHASVGSKLGIIKYETITTLVTNRVGYTPETFDFLKSARIVPDYGVMKVDAYSDVAKLINDFLAEVFCQEVSATEPWRYGLSAAVAEVMLGALTEPINGLLYPTVPMWGNADNIALRPEWSDHGLRPVHAEFVQVTDVAPPNVTYDVLDEARHFDDNGSIDWLGHQGQWELANPNDELTFLSVLGGYWEARDAHGNVVDPK